MEDVLEPDCSALCSSVGISQRTARVWHADQDDAWSVPLDIIDPSVKLGTWTSTLDLTLT